MSPTHNFYVYGHYKPDYNIFYIGKGHGRRAWKTTGRGEFWQNTVNKHGTYQVVLLHEHLSEDEAFLKEKEEIMFWGRRSDGGFLINLTDGGEGTSGYVFTAEQVANITAINQKLAQDPVWKAKQKAASQKRTQDPVWKANNKAANQKVNQDPAVRANKKAAAQKRAQDPAIRAKQKATMQKLAQDPVYKAAAQKRAQDPAVRAKIKAAAQKRAIEFSVISPDGTLYLTQRNLTEFSKVHGLLESNMRKVLKGNRNHHKGWKKYIPPINNHLLNQFI
jgi:hypothetical protein